VLRRLCSRGGVECFLVSLVLGLASLVVDVGLGRLLGFDGSH
jgi:hypothetical protein